MPYQLVSVPKNIEKAINNNKSAKLSNGERCKKYRETAKKNNAHSKKQWLRETTEIY